MGDLELGNGSIFKEMRESAKLSAESMAAKVGCAKSHIYRIENNESEPSLSLSKRWIQVTKPSMETILRLLIPEEIMFSASKAWRQKRREEDASNE